MRGCALSLLPRGLRCRADPMTSSRPTPASHLHQSRAPSRPSSSRCPSRGAPRRLALSRPRETRHAQCEQAGCSGDVVVHPDPLQPPQVIGRAALEAETAAHRGLITHAPNLLDYLSVEIPIRVAEDWHVTYPPFSETVE